MSNYLYVIPILDSDKVPVRYRYVEGLDRVSADGYNYLKLFRSDNFGYNDKVDLVKYQRYTPEQADALAASAKWTQPGLVGV